MNEHKLNLSLDRRQLLRSSACGFGYLAFAGMSAQAAETTSSFAVPAPLPLFPARAKRVIFLFMHGGPSHVDLFDYKPQLQKDDGRQLPFDAAPNISAVPKLMKSPWKFAQHGQSGLWMSELLPQISKHADDMCVIRSMLNGPLVPKYRRK